MPDKIKKLFAKPKNSSEVYVPKARDAFGKSFTGSYGGATQKIAVLPDRYKNVGAKLGWSPYELGNNLEQEANLQQGGLEMTWNMVKGFTTQAAAGFIDSVAAYDAKGLYDMASGNTEAKYGNWLNEIGAGIREYSENNHQIYQEGDSMWNVEYWAKQGQSLGYTGGIIGEAILEQVALGYLTGGAGNAASVAGLASKARLLKMGGQAMHGMFKGVQEGYMNALETQKNVYAKYKELGYDEKTAQKKANEAATLGYRAEVGPLAVLNAIQFATTFGVAKSAFSRGSGINQGFSGAAETLLGRVAPNVTSKWGKAGLGLGLNAVSEGLEEGIQTGVGKYAQHETLKTTGDAEGSVDLWDQEMRDSVIGGVLGGLLFAGGGKILSKYTQGTASKTYNTMHDNFLGNAEERVSKVFAERDAIIQEYTKAETAFNKDKTKSNFAKLQAAKVKIEEANHNVHLVNAANALNLDYITGKTTAFESHIEQMQGILDAVNNQDLDALQKYNLLNEDKTEKFEGSFETIKNTFANNIKSSEQIKESLENNLLNVTSDFESAFDITKKEFANLKQTESISQHQTALDILYQKDTQFNQLSPEAKTRFKLETELEALNRLDKLSELNKERKKEIEEELYELKGYKTADKRVVDSINKLSYVSAQVSIASNLQSMDENNAALKSLRDLSLIKEKLKKKAETKVKKAKTKEEVKEVVEDAKDKGVLTPELEAEAKGKADTLSAEENLKTMDPEFKPAPVANKPEPQITEPTAIEEEELAAFNDMFASGDLENASSREFQSNEVPEDKVEKIKGMATNLANRLDQKLGAEATFEDVIKDYIEKFGYDKIESSYEGIKYAWSSIGRDISNSKELYDYFFGDEALLNELEPFHITAEEAEVENTRTVEDAAKKQAKPVTYDRDNKPVDLESDYTIHQGVTANPEPKAAHLGMEYVEVINSRGELIKQPSTDVLNESSDIGNQFVLHPDMVKPGTELEIEIPENVDEILVADWIFDTDVNAWRKTSLPFGEWVKKHKVVKGSVEYNNKVPMIAKLDGDGVFLIHDTEWYNTTNISGVDTKEQRGNILKGKSYVAAIRENVISGNSTIVVTQRNFGQISRTNDLDPGAPPVPLNEATGDTTLAVATKYTTLSDNGTEDVNQRLDLINGLDTKNLVVGVVYDIRHVNTDKDGNKKYIALATVSNEVLKGEKLNDIAFNNVKFGIISSILLNAKGNAKILEKFETEYGMTLSKAEAIQKEILDTSGIDIKTNMHAYISMFTKTYDSVSDMITNLEDNTSVKVDGTLRHPNGLMHIAVDGNTIKMMQKTGKPVNRNAKGMETLPGINLNNITEASLPYISGLVEYYFGKNEVFKESKFDPSLKELGANNPMAIISETGEVSRYTGNKHGNNTYEGYTKDNLKTNVKSFPVKDKEGNVKWVTDIQPMVYYALKTEVVTPKVDETLKTTQQKAEEAAEKTIAEIDKDTQAALDAVTAKLSEEKKAKFSKFGKGPVEENFSAREMSQEEIDTIEGLDSNQIATITNLEQKKLTNSLFNLVLADTSLTNGTVNLSDIVGRINSSLETYLGPIIKDLQEYIENLEEANAPALEDKINSLKAEKAKLESIIENKEKIISNGTVTPKGDLFIKFERFLAEELTTTSEFIEDENGEMEYSFNMSSLEKDVKLTFSNNLKIFFSNVKKQNSRSGEEITNFAYLNDFADIDSVIQSLTELMVGLPSSIDSLINILESKKSNPIYNQILNKIRNSDEDVQNEILYKMIQSKLDMNMILYSFNRDTKTYSLRVLNANSTSSDVKLKLQWKADFVNSELFKTIAEERVYNKEAVQALIDRVNILSNKKIDSSNKEEIKEILNSLGITVGDNTIDTLIETEGKNIFLKEGILGSLTNGLKRVLTNGRTIENISYDSSTADPYSDSSGALERLIEIEVDLNGTRVSKSFRVGSKTIQGAIQKMMIYDVKESLKDTESALFQALEQIPYSKRNFVLELLKTVPKFQEFFNVSFVSLESIKQTRQKVYDDRKINKLANTDNMLTQFAFFTNTVRELKGVMPDSGLDFRMADMFNPALSDKEQMVLYTTAVLDLKVGNFDMTNLNNISAKDNVYDFMTTQIFEAEFDRIVSTYREPSNIKKYNGAAKRFLSIPEVNNITNAQGDSIHSLIAQGFHNQETMDLLRDTLKNKAREVIKNTVEADVKSKLNLEDDTGSWFNAGFLSNMGGTFDIHFFDEKYLTSKKNKQTVDKRRLAQMIAYDFVINQYLHQNTTYQLFAGDMALYAPNVENFVNKTTKEMDNVAFSKVIGESVSKRMAMLIAPGNKLANSFGDTYIQLFVNDPVKITSTSRSLIKQYYGIVSEVNEELLVALSQVENSIQNHYNSQRENEKFDERLSELESRRAAILKELQDVNTEISGYFNIEGTDAQEYTTWKEHMDILFRQGRLTVAEKTQLQIIYNKLENGQDLDSKELSLVMNPIKPVYAGSNILKNREGNAHVNRIVYIKTSSIPLLPQLTRDFKLDKIRVQLEKLQTKTKKNVRMTYQTGAKIGSIATKLTTNDLYSTPFEELYSKKLEGSILTLDRNNFKIQQDTPYKTAKNLKANKEDSTTMGSQMWKIVLGNGVNKMPEKVFPNYFGAELLSIINNKLPDTQKIVEKNGMVSGRDLDRIKFQAEKMYFEVQKEMLYDELGIDKETNRPFDKNETIKLVYDLLKKEVATRQYPDNIIDNLGLTKDEFGNMEFMLPLWLSTASNKFESLLQAIITNRLIQINLPGNQHISTSSEGFEKITSLEALDSNILSQIVWVNPSHTGELRPTTTASGVLKESEILVQSKFRESYRDENGKLKTRLIDLTKEPYSKMVDGFLVLDLDMIDEELLTSFSFRIPTSSHQSGAILKVVGFLPEASGDMLVVPKEHTQQIGEDFDIDKRTLYKSNYTVEEDKSLRKINYSETSNLVDKLTHILLEQEFEEHLATEEGATKKASLKAKTKMLENVMIDIYKSVYSSPSDEVQMKINKILSFDNATNTVALINDRINSSKDDKYFTIFSDDYQRAQMKLGADGKTSIGAHSNAVTLQAQLERLDNKVVITENVYDADGRKVGTQPSVVVLGKYRSEGVMGETETLDKNRNIGDVHTENQNSATDNIKAQIMGKRNENAYTMNVLIQLTYRGFDMVPFTPRQKGQDNKIQISSLFISQPILRRYVELMEQAKSITSEFSANKEQIIISQLVKEFSSSSISVLGSDTGVYNGKNLLSEEDYISYSKKMTGDRLYDNLINQKDLKTWESGVQIAVLQKFLLLSDEAKKVGEYQALINMSTTGLGISYFNVLDRIEVLNKLALEDNLDNIRDLVGDFVPNDGTEIRTPEELRKQGYYLVGENFIKPTTTEGTVLVNALMSGKAIMQNVYGAYEVTSVFGQTIDSIVKNREIDGPISKKAKLDLRFRAITFMRDYIYSGDLGFFEGDINAEREMLFFDRKGNQSLATFLRDLKLTKRNPLMYTNELLKSLTYDKINKNSIPSIIKHEADFNSNFDKTDKYNSFMELMQDDKTDLGTFNGIPMTPRKLAQTLATYAYLANNENGAIGFRDFINVNYLNTIGVSERIRSINNGKEDFNSSLAELQFYQHNPEEAYTFNFIENSKGLLDVNNEAIGPKNGVDLKKLESFKLQDNKYPYVSIRDTSIKNSDNVYRLYRWNGVKYVRIPVLGTFGFNEANPNSINQKSLIYPKVGSDIFNEERELSVEPTSGENLNSVVDVSDGIVSVFRQLYETTENSSYKKFMEEISSYIDPETKVVISEDPNFNTGKYSRTTNTITISSNILNFIEKNYGKEDTQKVFEEIIMEEILHSITVKQISEYGTVDLNGNLIPNEDAPIFVHRIAALHAAAREALPTEYYVKDIYEFMAGTFAVEEFKEQLDNIQVEGKSLYQHFKDTIKGMVRYLTGATYSSEVVNTVNEFLKYHNTRDTSTKRVDILADMKKKDSKSDAELVKFKEKVESSKVSLKEIGKDNINVAVTTGSGDGHVAWKTNQNNAYDQTGVKVSNGPFVHTHKDGEISFHIPFNYLDSRAGSHLVVAIKGYKKEDIDADEVSILLQKIALNIKKNVPLSIAEKKVAVMKVVNDTIDEFLSKESDQGLNAQEESIEDLLGSDLFSSGGEDFSNREFRLPEIKKCK